MAACLAFNSATAVLLGRFTWGPARSNGEPDRLDDAEEGGADPGDAAAPIADTELCPSSTAMSCTGDAESAKPAPLNCRLASFLDKNSGLRWAVFGITSSWLPPPPFGLVDTRHEER